jgi:hypothetical protein
MTADPELQRLLDSVTSPTRRRDADTLLEMMGRVTGLRPQVERNAVGFGSYHYKYASGREGDAAALGFAPRKAATTVYLMNGVGAHTELLERLGPHTTGVGCLYLKDLSQVDLAVLEEILRRTYAALTAGVYGQRAREGGATTH